MVVAIFEMEAEALMWAELPKNAGIPSVLESDTLELVEWRSCGR
ncbi:MAG TPA: hypothetical protein VHS06_10810 [Chloroflexota bacterium]|nr:hypothetical protein [Chloroflexota bacterium]